MTTLQPASLDTYKTKYQLKTQDGTPIDKDLDDTFKRVAKALAKVEKEETPDKMDDSFLLTTPIVELTLHQSYWYAKFLYALRNGAIPAGRILSNAGAEELKPNTSLINCTVSGTISDNIEGIGQAVKESMETLAKGCGIGYCFSSLRPKGALVGGVGATTSGSLSFMNIFDSACFTISSAGGRRGAQMGTMHVWHPDIIDFIKAKREDGRFRQFNLSVLLTDEFMKAVEADEDWKLYFPLHKKEKDTWYNSVNVSGFPFSSEDYVIVANGDVVCKVYQTIKARELWDLIMKSTFEYAEPGVLFIDRINESNPLSSEEVIVATNPCLHPDSLVETIHGRVRIADIAEPTMVYTMLADGSLGIKKASASFVSATQVKTLRITTRNGKMLRVTPNHLVKVHEGTKVGIWKRADELKVGDVVVQLCRARRGAAYSGVKLSSEDNRAYRMEHVMIADAVYGVAEDEDVHHLDGNTYNNCIDNLEVMSHGNHARHTALNDNPQNHQRYCEHTGQFLPSFEKKSKTIVAMPEELRSNMKNSFSSAILKIERDEELVDVYDLTVEDTHNFIADFCVVHNCGEQPLPPYGSCLLGSLLLTKFVENPFEADKEPYETGAYFDWDKFKEVTRIFVRMLDNVVELNGLALPEQVNEITSKRRHGMGFLGLGSALAMLRIPYGSVEAIAFTEEVAKILAVVNLEEGIALSQEKGGAPIFEDDRILHSWVNHPFTLKVLAETDFYQADLYEYSCRFTHATSIAPTGTLSLAIGNNCSNGIEPSFAHEYKRNIVKEGHKTKEQITVYSAEALLWKELYGDTPYPNYFTIADDLTPAQHVAMQAAAQKWVDSSISKTVNCPTDISFEDFKQVYIDSYHSGLKGCATFRFNPEIFSGVLVKEEDLAATLYEFTLESGDTLTVAGNETVIYEGEEHKAANLFDALKEGYYGKF